MNLSLVKKSWTHLFRTQLLRSSTRKELFVSLRIHKQLSYTPLLPFISSLFLRQPGRETERRREVESRCLPQVNNSSKNLSEASNCRKSAYKGLLFSLRRTNVSYLSKKQLIAELSCCLAVQTNKRVVQRPSWTFEKPLLIS